MIERNFKPESRFVHVVLRDDMNDAQVREHLIAYNQEAADLHAVLELVDCRPLTDISDLTAQGCFQNALLEEGQPWSRGGKLAVFVTNKHQYGMARAYCISASSYRQEAEVFYELREALEWLQPDEDLGEILTFIESNVPSEDFEA